MSESSATLYSSATTPKPVPEDWTPGRIGYEAYAEHPGVHGPWTTFDGRHMPTWSDLLRGGPAGQLTRDRWEIAARTIITEYEQRSGAESTPTRKEPSTGTITVHVPELKVDVSDLEPQLERLEGLVNQLTTAPVSMSDLCHGARALAEASAFLNTSDSDASKAVSELVKDLAKCLGAQVRELTPPTQS